jgi:hypothetical protein
MGRYVKLTLVSCVWLIRTGGMDMNGHIEKEGQEKEAGSGQEMGGKTQGAADSDGEDMQVGEDKAVENGQRAITPQERQRPGTNGSETLAGLVRAASGYMSADHAMWLGVAGI